MSDIKHFIKEIFLPSKCRCCGRLADKDYLCADCAPKIARERIPENERKLNKKFELVDAVYASYYYSGAAEDAVKYAKFRNPQAFLRSFLEDISIDISRILEENNVDMVISVPYHKSKLYSQEYDLPQEMTKLISSRFSVPVCTRVTKILKTKRQHDLPLDKRKVNLINAYTVNADLTGKNILITDDVTTSGNTLSALATELKLAGAEKVFAWVYTYNTYERKNKNGNRK